MPDDPVPGLPQEVNAKPITIGAFATKILIRGELVMFYLNRSGRLTCDKMELSSDTPKLKAVE